MPSGRTPVVIAALIYASVHLPMPVGVMLGAWLMPHGPLKESPPPPVILTKSGMPLGRLASSGIECNVLERAGKIGGSVRRPWSSGWRRRPCRRADGSRGGSGTHRSATVGTSWRRRASRAAAGRRDGHSRQSPSRSSGRGLAWAGPMWDGCSGACPRRSSPDDRLGIGPFSITPGWPCRAAPCWNAVKSAARMGQAQSAIAPGSGCPRHRAADGGRVHWRSDWVSSA